MTTIPPGLSSRGRLLRNSEGFGSLHAHGV